MKTLQLWMSSKAQDSSWMHEYTYVGWDTRSLQRHKATECKLVKKSDTFNFREMNQHMTQILCRNKTHKVKHALNSLGITMVRQNSFFLHQLSWIAVYVQTFYAIYEALTQWSAGLSIHWQTPFSSLSVLQCRDNFSDLFLVRSW